MADRRDEDRARKLMVRGLGWCLCLVLWTVALLTLFPVRIGQAVTPAALHFSGAKLLHISAYAFLTVYLKWLPLRGWRWLLLAVLSLHAFGTEFFQQFVPGRHGAPMDVLIDHLGITIGMALTWRCWLPRSSYSSFSRDPKGSAAELARSPSGRS